MSTFFKSSLLLGLALALGRIVGFVREMLVAARLGVSAEADIAVVFLTLPDFLVGLLLAGGFTAALVPALKRETGDARDALFRFVGTWSMAISILLALLVALNPSALFGILAPGLSPQQTQPWLSSVVYIALSVPLASFAGLIGAYLNVRGIFFIVGLGTVAYNLTLCAVLLPNRDPATVLSMLSLGVLAAGLVRLGLLGFVAKPPVQPRIAPPASADGRLARLFVSGVLATGIVVLSGILFRTLAARVGEGELTAFALALRLFELPMGLAIAPLTTVLLPSLSTAAPDPGLMRRAFVAGVGLAGLALVVGQIAGDPIARLIYFRGEMTEAGMADIIRNARWMFWALPFAAASLIAATVLNAARRTDRVLVNSVIALIAGTAVALTGPAMVLPGFVVFHAVSAGLNLVAIRGRTGPDNAGTA